MATQTILPTGAINNQGPQVLADHFVDEHSPTDQNDSVSADPEKNSADFKDRPKTPASLDSHELNPNDQQGVRQAEAITLAWTKKSLYMTYFFIFIASFINVFESQVTGNLIPFVTSSFSVHSLIPVIYLVSNLLGGIIKFPTAKIIDLWGRAEGFAAMTFLMTLGLVLMAACNNVQTFGAAYVIHMIGYVGMNYVTTIIIADTSSLANRALIFAVVSIPWIPLTFAGPATAEAFYLRSSYRWAFGTFAILTPVCAAPILSILFYNQSKAKKGGLLVKTATNRTLKESLKHYAIEFDAVGIFLLSAGLVMFLLPFTLAQTFPQGWGSPTIIALLVVGFVLTIAFGVFERFYAPKPFIPFALLTSPTVIGASGLTCTIFIAFYCWDGYYTSYLQVVHNTSIAQAGYIGNIYSIGSCSWSLVVGLLIKWSGRYKWLALLACPIQTLGVGLMIYFRQPQHSIGYVVMCQIFIAISGGTFVICEQLAVMAVAEHGQVAAIMAFLGLSSSIGGGIGSAISGAIWTNTLPVRLLEYLPEDAKDQAATIYGSLPTQLSYPVGSPVRNAIIRAYADTQQRMCIAATAVLVLIYGFVWIWKDVRVKDVKQTKGLVM